MTLALPIAPPRTPPVRAGIGLSPAALARNGVPASLPQSGVTASLPQSGVTAACDRRLANGRTLFHAGDEARWLYEVVEGVLKLWTTTPDGQLLILDFLVPGDVVGLELSSVHPHTAEAVGRTIVRPILRSQMLVAMLENSGPADALGELARRRDLASQRHLSLLGLHHSSQRLAGFIAFMAERMWGDSRSSGMITLPMLQRDIARHLSMAPETLCRSLRQLSDRRLIRQHQRFGIEIPDRATLAAYMAGH